MIDFAYLLSAKTEESMIQDSLEEIKNKATEVVNNNMKNNSFIVNDIKVTVMKVANDEALLDIKYEYCLLIDII